MSWYFDVDEGDEVMYRYIRFGVVPHHMIGRMV